MRTEVAFVLKNLFFARFRAQKLAQFCQVNGGMLLYGPPGSGKSFLARAVGNVWKRADPGLVVKLVRGPELFNQFVGKTEEAIRALFGEAEANCKDHAAGKAILVQHLVIIDEIDSMFGSRGSDSSSGAADRATAMFISMMDDLSLRSNLFFIGTTNRFDLVDPAVIRKGRLGLHLQIAAMDTEDKVDILNLYLEQLQALINPNQARDDDNNQQMQVDEEPAQLLEGNTKQEIFACFR